MQQEHYKFLILLLFFAGCSRQETEIKPQRPIPVATEIAMMQTVPISIETIGHVTAPCVVEIRPQVGGTLLSYHIKPGQMVKKEDLLITIDPRPYQAALDKAEANLAKNQAAAEFAKKRVQRYSDLVKKEYISKLSFDEYQKEQATAEAQVKNDLAEVALARINLDYCRIEAPMDGKVSNFIIDPGNVISPNVDKLTEIRQISPIGVQFSVPQRDLQHMQRYKCGEDLKIEVILPHEGGDGYTDDAYIGKIFFLDNHIDPSTGTILLKGMVENEEHLLWPGEFVIVRMQLRQKIDALLIPETAVQIGQKGPFVYVVDEDLTANVRPVILGEKVGDKRVVEEGMKAGERIVTTGHINLAQGKKVVL